MSIFNRMIEAVQVCLDEFRYKDIMNKQKSITQLFPDFRQKIQGVSNRGGFELKKITSPEIWEFEVNSGTKDNVSYNVYVRFMNIKNMLKKFVPAKELWTRDKKTVDLKLLAAEVLNGVDIETDCDCPADLYWGSEYIKTGKKAQFGRQEDRPPVIRNPRKHGTLCKHANLVFELLPMFTTTFAKFLKDFYIQDIAELENQVKEEDAELQKEKEKKAPKKKEVQKPMPEPEEEEEVEAEPDEEQIEEPIQKPLKPELNPKLQKTIPAKDIKKVRPK